MHASHATGHFSKQTICSKIYECIILPPRQAFVSRRCGCQLTWQCIYPPKDMLIFQIHVCKDSSFKKSMFLHSHNDGFGICKLIFVPWRNEEEEMGGRKWLQKYNQVWYAWRNTWQFCMVCVQRIKWSTVDLLEAFDELLQRKYIHTLAKTLLSTETG